MICIFERKATKYADAGLCTCNFIDSLHFCGIGCCCLQWSNKHNEKKYFKNVRFEKAKEFLW